MGGEIGVGVWVECVRPHETDYDLQRGRVYCVESIKSYARSCLTCRDFGVTCHQVGIALAGVRTGCVARHWCSNSFKPIYRPTAELLENLLHDITEPVLEPA